MSTQDRRQVFSCLVREHAAMLHHVAARLVGRGHDAEDLVQETFLRAWRGLHRFRGEADAKTWLYRILLNVSHDRHRRRSRFLPWRRKVKAQEPEPPRQAEQRDLLDRVLGAVSGLPRRQRECLLLRVRAGFSYREVADVMGIREGGVKSLLVEARRTLLRRFGEEVTG